MNLKYKLELLKLETYKIQNKLETQINLKTKLEAKLKINLKHLSR